MTAKKPFRSGYVALIGRPNAGKSTLLNALLGEKMAIVTPKPQTTRQGIRGILTRKDFQIVFTDTPGYHEADSLLNKTLVKAALDSLPDADVILYLIDATRGLTKDDRSALEHVRKQETPKICLVNKIDQVEKPKLLPLLQEISGLASWEEVIPVSALTGDGLNIVVEAVAKRLPEGPAYFPADQLSDANERFRAAEVVREKLFGHLHEEIPYSIAVEIESFEELPKQNRVRALIHVERDSQKGMVIGKQGQMLKTVGTEARQELEGLWRKKVFLELHVDVIKNWTKDPEMLERFGYDGGPKDRE